MKFNLKTVIWIGVGLLVLALAFEVVRKSILIDKWKSEAVEQEAKRLEAEGHLTASLASQRVLRREAEVLGAQVADLEERLGAKPREVVRWKTREIGIPIPAPTAPEGPTAPGEPICADPTCPDVRVKLKGTEARLETRDGNLVAVGQVEVWRTSPPPEERVAVEPFEVTGYKFDAPPPQRVRWSVGPAIGITAGGWAAGVQAVAPPVALWRVEARPTGLVSVNVEGEASAFVGLTFGWRRK